MAKYKIVHYLNQFFAGIGSQAKALKNLGVEFEDDRNKKIVKDYIKKGIIL